MEKLIVSIPNKEMAQKVWDKVGRIGEAIYYPKSKDTRYRIKDGKFYSWSDTPNYYENEEKYKDHTFITAEEFLSGSYKKSKEEFKVGDRVKTPFDTGKIKVIISRSHLVEHDTWNNGHGGSNIYRSIFRGGKCWWFLDYELEKLLLKYSCLWDHMPIEPLFEPIIKKKSFMSNIMQKLKDLTLSETDRLLREEGFEDENGKMTSQAKQLMDEELRQERWQKRRVEVAENIKKIRESEKK